MIYIDVDTAVEVPVNVVPLTDDTDFKTRETGVAYNAAGMDLVWNFVTPNGTITQTAVTPTTAGDYDWSHVGDGMYKIEIPASGGASINNDTEGVGYFSGVCDGVLPWRGPDIVFRAAGLNDALIESAYSTTRGLAGTALPAAAADAAGGLPVSDAGGLDLDARLDAAVSSRSSHSAADVWTSGTRTLTAFSFSVDLNADQSGVTIGTVTTNTDMRGTDNAATASALATVDSNVDAILVDTGSTLDAKIDYIDALVNAVLEDTGTTLPGILGTPAGADLATDVAAIDTVVDAIKLKTDGLPSDPADASDIAAAFAALNDLDAAGIRAALGMAAADFDTQIATLATAAAVSGLNDLDSSAVQAACNAALVALHLDHLLGAAYDPASKPGNASALWNVLLENDGGVPRYTVNALEQAPSGGGGGGGGLSLSDAVTDEAEGTVGGALDAVDRFVRGKKAVVQVGEQWKLRIYKADGTTVWLELDIDDPVAPSTVEESA